MKMMTAFCWADGTIGFSSNGAPIGALVIAEGGARKLRNAVAANARHSYDGKTLIVSGVRDVHIGFRKGDAVVELKSFCARVKRSMSNAKVGGLA
jgi:hypothetical protein